MQWDPGVSGNRRSAGHMGLAAIMTDLCGHPGHRQAVCRLHAAVTSVSRGLWKGFAWSWLQGARGSHPGPVPGAVSLGVLTHCQPVTHSRDRGHASSSCSGPPVPSPEEATFMLT